MRSGGHWSRPAAWRTWNALMRLGGRGTTAQIHNITGSMAVHQDIYSLRMLLQMDYGFSEEETRLEVLKEDLGENDSGRRVVCYTLGPRARALHRVARREPGGNEATDARVGCIPPPARVGQSFLWDLSRHPV
jgi:hypothetical protein